MPRASALIRPVDDESSLSAGSSFSVESTEYKQCGGLTLNMALTTHTLQGVCTLHFALCTLYQGHKEASRQGGLFLLRRDVMARREVLLGLALDLSQDRLQVCLAGDLG
jgi:hypothetical protein